jgi:hypothetical protein
MMVDFWERMMNSWQAARRAWSSYGAGGLGAIATPTSSQWDAYDERMKRYALFEGYYHNRVYFMPRQLQLIQSQRPSLYKNIRGIYNPFWRLCRMYESNVYPSLLDMDTLQTGAIPIQGASPELIEALRWVWMWSAWGRMKGLYVRNGAKLGDSVLKVVDDRTRDKVRIEVLDPRKLADVTLDEMLNVKSCVIEYDKRDAETGETYTYTEIINRDEFVTLRDGGEYGYFADGTGRKVSRWRNEYGFVPVALAQNTLTGWKFGENVAPFNILHKIDEVNDLATLLHDQIRKTVNVIWYFAGVSSKDIKSDAGERDRVPTISGPVGSTVTPMVANLNIAEVGETIKGMLEEIERDVPELALYRVREQRNSTEPGVRAVLSDAQERIQLTQANYDAALISAQMMAVAIGGYRGISGFDGFGLESYSLGALNHMIEARGMV